MIDEELTDCAVSNKRKWSYAPQSKMRRKYELSCGCESVALSELLSDYECQECGELYFYSFCLKEVVDTNSFWHCNDCGTCRESAEWHCKKCHDCTYGLTLACDGCGAKSPYA